MELNEIKEQLFAWFAPEEYKNRPLPGGGRWFYLSHQAIRDRLNEICYGEWEETYSDPVVIGNSTFIKCQLTICGVTRTGIADDKTYPELNADGKEKIIGTVLVNVARHAFRDAAEKFGIGAHLDEQKGADKKKFIDYMSGKGDRRASQFTHEQDWVDAGAMGKPSKKPAPVLHPEHKEQLNEISRILGMSLGKIRFVLSSFFGHEQPEKLNLDEFELLLEKMAIAHVDSNLQLVEEYRKARLIIIPPVQRFEFWHKKAQSFVAKV